MIDLKKHSPSGLTPIPHEIHVDLPLPTNCSSGRINSLPQIMSDSSEEEVVKHKQCPFCAETIKAEAIKCRYCGELLYTESTTTSRSSTNQRCNEVNRSDSNKQKSASNSSFSFDKHEPVLDVPAVLSVWVKLLHIITGIFGVFIILYSFFALYKSITGFFDNNFKEERFVFVLMIMIMIGFIRLGYILLRHQYDKLQPNWKRILFWIGVIAIPTIIEVSFIKQAPAEAELKVPVQNIVQEGTKFKVAKSVPSEAKPNHPVQDIVPEETKFITAGAVPAKVMTIAQEETKFKVAETVPAKVKPNRPVQDIVPEETKFKAVEIVPVEIKPIAQKETKFKAVEIVPVEIKPIVQEETKFKVAEIVPAEVNHKFPVSGKATEKATTIVTEAFEPTTPVSVADNQNTDNRNSPKPPVAGVDWYWYVSDLRMEFLWNKDSDCWWVKYEVSNAQYRKFKPDHEGVNEFAARNVSDEDAVEYAKWLTDRELKAGRLPVGYSYRLPSKEEWHKFSGRPYAKSGFLLVFARSTPSLIVENQVVPAVANRLNEQLQNTKASSSLVTAGLPYSGPVAGADWKVPDVGIEFVWHGASACWIGKDVITNGQYRMFKPDYIGNIKNGDSQPFTGYISYTELSNYAKWLTERERKAGRLPEGYHYRDGYGYGFRLMLSRL